MGFDENIKSKKIYTPAEAAPMITKAMKGVKTYKKRRKKMPSIIYYNCFGGFDIETSSFINSAGEKVAIMYEWTFGLNGLIMIGRTWNDFIKVCDTLKECLGLCIDKRLIIGVHNLGYEFQFMRHYFEWSNVFATEVRKPVYAVTCGGLEFRDTYILSGFSLDTVGKSLTKYHIEKKVGDLDYSKVRHSQTPLSDKEIGYCVNDVMVVMAYLEETKEKDGGGNVTRIPLTNTGRVRRFVSDHCFKGSKYQRYNYSSIIQKLTLKGSEYKDLKQSFQGGFTHASPFYVGEVVPEVQSMDLTSSYPTQLCLPNFPISRGEMYTPKSMDDFNDCLKNYCCLFELDIEGLESTFIYDAYISRSRCLIASGVVVSNGRIVSADHLRIIITEKDYEIIKKCYSWKRCKVGRFRRYDRGYLPKEIILSVLTLYKSKTELKGLTGLSPEGIDYKELYMSRKGMLNSCYGMMVTDIVKDTISYDDDWNECKALLNEEITKYNENPGRFLFYPWGVWCTACARLSLWSAIYSLKDDYIYSDTDSVKYINGDKHKVYFDKYNAWITKALRRTCDHFGLSYDYIEPVNSKGIKKPLGIWDFDGSYEKFKTLGAKRYMVQYKDSHDISLTVSGLNKKITVPYLLDKYGKEGIFNAFTDTLYIPKGKTGKNTHTYIDDARSGTVTDYQGTPAYYNELSAVHLSESDYSLSLSEEFLNFITQVKEEFF